MYFVVCTVHSLLRDIINSAIYDNLVTNDARPVNSFVTDAVYLKKNLV
jgi:hypothetical protein